MAKERLDKLLSSLGYCSRKEVRFLLKEGVVTHKEGSDLRADSGVTHEEILFDGEPLDPPHGSVWLLNKPTGYVCSHATSEGLSVYELFPERYRARRPTFTSVGRLDRDASGVLIFTDDGQLLHTLTSPKHHVQKRYLVRHELPLRGDEAALFASGTLVLPPVEDEDTSAVAEKLEKPCLPATLESLEKNLAALTLFEGRYHQVKRMFEAVGNRVLELHRSHFGAVTLTDEDKLELGEWKLISREVFNERSGS